MITTPDSRQRVAWLRTKMSAALLVALLQRSPALRFVQATTHCVSAPVAAILKSALATIASLGAVHSLAGATSLIATAPSPVTVQQGQPIAPIAFTVSDTINLGSWRIGGSIPPGLRVTASQGGAELTGPGILDATTGGSEGDIYAPGTAGNTMTLPVIVGTPTQAGTFNMTFQAYQLGGLTGFNTVAFNYTITVAASAAANTPPTFTTQPAPQTVAAGATVTLAAAASGTPAPSFQWQKAGTAIAGATNATLTLSNVQPSDAGTYTLVATNSAGEARSTPVTVAVTNPTATAAPAIARQPQAQTVPAGSTVVFNAEASGAPLSFQWRRNNAAIPGATNASLVIKATVADAGTYSVVISNSIGSTTSEAAALALTNEPNFGHLVNLSIRTQITAAEPFFTVGTVVGGAGTSGPKPMLVRAVG
ncbi:MAG: immunoglobulin domain-containing protein, partial [Opitutaceae bacterium]